MKIRHLIRWRDWNFATKLSILFIATTFLGLAGFTLAADAHARSDVLAQARVRNLQRARATAQLLDFYLASVDANVQLIAVAPGTLEFLDSAQRDTRREEIMQVLEFARTRGGYDAAFLLNPHGDVLIATDARLVGRNYTTATWFRNAAAGRTTFDEPRYDAVEGKVFLHVSAPITTPRGQVVGAAVVRLTLEPIDNITAADLNYDGRGAFSYLVDENGIRLSHPLRQDLRFQPVAPLPSDLFDIMVFELRYGPDTAKILQSASNFLKAAQRVKYLLVDNQADPFMNIDTVAVGPAELSAAPLKKKRWIYILGVSQANLLAEVNRQTQSALLQAMAVGLIALVVSVLGARWVTRPLRRVAEGANALAAGDLSRRIGLNQRDEVGQLAAAFDAMAEALEQKDAALRKHAAELQAANEELEAFSYSVSHDLRAPLRAIDGYTRILLEDYEPILDAEGKGVCGVIHSETQRMSRLINDLLAFSRLGRTEMRTAPFDMTALAHAVFAELTTPESRTRIDFRVAALPPADGDPTLLRQVWVNLLSNAIKFSSKRERAVIDVDCAQSGDDNTYFVRDNGAGFEMEYANKLFGVFQRLHSENEFEGTGVGLAIVQRVIHRHGGRVWGEGAVDAGATFYFTLPPRKGARDE